MSFDTVWIPGLLGMVSLTPYFPEAEGWNIQTGIWAMEHKNNTTTTLGSANLLLQFSISTSLSPPFMSTDQLKDQEIADSICFSLSSQYWQTTRACQLCDRQTDRLPAKACGCSTRAEAPASANPRVCGERRSPIRGCKRPHGQTQPLIQTICFHRGPWGFQYGTLNETGISSWRSAPACCQQPWQPMSSPTRAATTSTGHARFGADYGTQCPYPGVPQVAEAPGRASDYCKALGTRVWGGRAEEACGRLGYGQVGASLLDCKTVRE